MSSRAARRQSGQVLVFLAFAIVVLAAMLGLIIDGGMAQSQKQLSQEAADGAALAAGFNVQQFPANATFAAATASAQNVVTRDGLAASTLTLAYLKSDHTTAATSPANTTYVDATVTFNTNTYFMRIVSFNTFSVSSFAEVTLPTLRGTCAICLMSPSGNSAHYVKNDNMTVNGGSFFLQSSDAQAIKFDGTGTTLTVNGYGIYIVGCYQASAQNTITPTPTCSQATITDPDASAPYPSIANHLTYSGGNATLSSGIYNGLNIASGSTVTLNPGVYVLTGDLVLSGTLTGATSGGDGSGGATIFLACSSYPTPCTNTGGSGQVGAQINKSGGGLSLPQPTSGTYKGLSIFADRNNTGTNQIDQGTTETVSGTWYTLRMPFAAIHSNSVITVGNFIVDSFSLAQNVTLNVSYIPGTSYTPPGGSVPLSRLALTT